MLDWISGPSTSTPSTLAPSSTSVVDVHAAPASLEGVVSRTVHDLVFGAPLTEQSTPEQVNARLYDAAYAGDVMTLLDAIFLGGNPLARNEGAGNSAIHAAAAGGHARALELLLREERSRRASPDGLVGPAVPVEHGGADGPVSGRGANDVEL